MDFSEITLDNMFISCIINYDYVEISDSIQGILDKNYYNSL